MPEKQVTNMDLEKVRKAIQEKQYEWKKHVLIRLAQRNIMQETVIRVILEGEIIEDYPEDKIFPSGLMFAIALLR